MFASAIAVFIAGVGAVSQAAAQGHGSSLAFLEPQGIANGAAGVKYTSGQHINITWTTPFDHTTLKVWEGPFTDGSFMVSVLADKWPKDRTHVTWKVTPATENSRHGFHFELQKGYQPNDCAGCVLNSPNFAILQTPLTPTFASTSSRTSKTSSHAHSQTTTSHPRSSTTRSKTSTSQSTSTSSSSSSPSSSSTTTSSSSSSFTLLSPTQTSSPTRTNIGLANAGASASASSTPSYLPDSTNSEHGLGVGLAVGFGVGVPFIIALYAVLLFLYTRAQRRTETVRLVTVEDDVQRLNEKTEHRSATNSWISKFSMASVFTQATSYHEPFEFQQSDGSKRPGSERLFRNGEQIPGSPGRFFRQ